MPNIMPRNSGFVSGVLRSNGAVRILWEGPNGLATHQLFHLGRAMPLFVMAVRITE
jgi:hypothetical protein